MLMPGTLGCAFMHTHSAFQKPRAHKYKCAPCPAIRQIVHISHFEQKKMNKILIKLPFFSKIGKKISLLILAIPIGALLTLVFEEALSFLFTILYMQYYDIPQRSDLSEDYGFGIVSFFFSLLVIIIILPLATWRVWKKLSNKFIS